LDTFLPLLGSGGKQISKAGSDGKTKQVMQSRLADIAIYQ
jgi:hypothetical protein